MKNEKRAILTIPPKPGDLSEIRHLVESDRFKVEVKKSTDSEYEECFVYETDNYAGNRFQSERRLQESASFAAFSFIGVPVDVRITCNFEVDSVVIRPMNFGIVPEKNGNVITFALNTQKKLSVEINGRQNPLFIFADMPDEPEENATYFYGPGIHHIGQNKMIRSGEHVYIAAGAVVQGSFRIEDNAENVSIRGRGILNVGNCTPVNDCSWLSENCTITAKANHHLYLEGLILTNAAGWTVSVTDSRGWDMPKAIGEQGKGSYHNQYRNLKLISWNGNSDGIWFDGDDAVIDDCFIFNNDDCVTTHGSHNCKISNLIFWGGPWGRFFYHCDWSSSSNLTFENIYIIGKEQGESIIRICSRDAEDHGCELKDFTFRNIYIEDYACELMHIDNHQIKITNMTFENITIAQPQA